MNSSFHIYTPEEVDSTNHSSIHHNWNPKNYLINASINDPNTGVRQVCFIAFENKLNALNYFRNFLTDIKEDCPKKSHFLKLSEIDNSINLIKANRTDKYIDLSIVDFYFEDISLNTCNSGYWINTSKLILKQIIDEIDVYFEIQDADENEDDYTNLKNSRYSTSSLKETQVECQNLISHENTCDQIFVEKFNELCHYMNDFWDFCFE
ncbi:hypothetical protein [Clostridium algidicarnis]|uniref:hypothetical protein n=1 Tax=Clostridium algidicarnis TaxID=37659 RepID=UPI0004983021|nr:hypothetical protein [Clostridium algidicarnis]